MTVEETTDRSELITPCVVNYLSSLAPVQTLLGRNPVRVFPGAVALRDDGKLIYPQYVKVEEITFDEEMHFGGGSGIFKCQLSVAAIADTNEVARRIYATLRKALSGKYSVTWDTRLRIGESQLSAGGSVPLLMPDGYPTPWAQIAGELFLLCEVLPLAS